MLSFNQIAADLRVPGAYVEFDSSRARGGLPVVSNRVLIIGQKLAAGTAPALVPQRLFSADAAGVLFGKASILARCYRAFKLNDPASECWGIALDDLAGGTAATGTITVSGPATAAGTIALMIAGQPVAVAVASASSANTIATAIAAAIAAADHLPVTAAAVAAVVTLTARHKGTAGNDVDVRHSYYQGEALPAGVGLTIAGLSAGAGDPDHAAVWTAIGDGAWRTIILAHASATILTSAEGELASRWSPARMLESFGWAARPGSVGDLTSFGAARNSHLVSIMGAGDSPSAPWEWAGGYGAVGGYYSAIDPARPLQTLEIKGVLAPSENARFTKAEREALLHSGIATHTSVAGNVLIERAVTTYQVNVFGEADTAYLDAETVLTLHYLRQVVRARFLAKYPRYKLASDGTRFGAGQKIVTPSVLRAELLALFRELEEAGLVENLDQFKTDLIVERDASDPNRVNALIPPDLVNQLRVFAAQIQFRV